MVDEQTTTEAALELAADAQQLAAQAASTDDATDEEDYAWLTERLDALDARQSQMMELLNNSNQPSQELTTALHSQTEQNRMLTEMVNSTQARLTELHELVLSRLTPQTSTSSSQAEDTEQTPNLTPANPDSDGSAAPTEPGEVAGAKKRRRI